MESRPNDDFVAPKAIAVGVECAWMVTVDWHCNTGHKGQARALASTADAARDMAATEERRCLVCPTCGDTAHGTVNVTRAP